MERAYAEAAEAAALDDFDVSFNPGTQKCVAAVVNSSGLFAINLKRHEVIEVIRGTPPSGPLFPGEPDRTQVTAGFVFYRWTTGTDGELKGILDRVVRTGETMNTEGNEFVVVVQRDYQIEDSPVEIRIKRNGATLHFKLKVFFGSYQEQLFYGYCWRE